MRAEIASDEHLWTITQRSNREAGTDSDDPVFVCVDCYADFAVDMTDFDP